ncbi:hypothetical protein [Embleya sp. NPDC005575]|uniref:helix-turn-helix domain-containing protein n=1 Tax=Embleya sp. NPDC005575 TaxID=3156892 RepID=UPI0033BBAF4C
MDARTGRRCHNVLNPLHSLVYFAPEGDPEFVAIGLKTGRMGYFASPAGRCTRGRGRTAGVFATRTG